MWGKSPCFWVSGMHMTEDLSWTINNTAVVKQSQTQLHFTWTLKETNLQEKLLVSCYCCSIPSMQAYCILAVFPRCSAKRVLQRVINTTQKIIGCSMPSLEDLFSSGCLSKQPTYSKNHPILDTICFTCYTLVDASGPSTHKQT